MASAYAHTCVRVFDPEASQRFYEALGFEPRGRLNFETAYNIYMGLPGDADVLELTVNLDQDEPYSWARATTTWRSPCRTSRRRWPRLEPLGVQPEKPPFHPGGRDELPLICFVPDPDGYRIELIEGDRFETPQDPAP